MRRVEQLRGLQPLAPAQRGQQAQHRGCGHARNRGAERQAQALDRRGQRGADRLQVRRALQRRAGAVQRRHHAEEGAQHAQQHQQAGQIRRQRRAGQGRRARLRRAGAPRCAGWDAACRARRPGCGGGPDRSVDGARQRGRGLAVAAQFERAHQVEGADQQRDGQRQRVRADVAGADPAHGGQADEKDDEMKDIWTWRPS